MPNFFDVAAGVVTITKDGYGPQTALNGGPGSLYYRAGTTVSSSSNDGTLASGSSLSLTGLTSFVAVSQGARLVVSDPQYDEAASLAASVGQAGGVASLDVNDHVPETQTPLRSGVTLVEADGHSYPGAGGTVRGDQECYVDKFAQAVGSRRRRNIAWGGSLASWPQSGTGAAGDGGYGWTLQTVVRDTNGAPYVPRSQVVLLDQAVHDLAELGSLTPRPLLEAYRTKLARYCSAAVFEVDPAGASHSSWAFSGAGWADLAITTANSGTGLRFTSTIGNSATWTVPADRLTTQPVAVGMFVNAAHDLTVGVSIDGGAETLVRLQASVLADQNVASKNIGVVLRFGRDSANAGLAANSPLDFPAQLTGGVSHTIAITLRTQTIGASQMCVDYAHVEADPLDGPVALAMGAVRPPSYATWNGKPHGPDAGTDPMNDASFTTWNAAIKGMLAEFPNAVFVDGDAALAKTAAYFETGNNQAHPNPKGHALLAKAARDALFASALLTARVLSHASATVGPFWEPIGQAGRTIAFQNSWVNFGGGFNNAGAHRDLDGIVHLRGGVKTGSSAGAAIFTLPAGYRPAAPTLVPAVVSGGGTNVNVSVDSAGVVKFLNGGNTAGSWLDGISFPADQ